MSEAKKMMEDLLKENEMQNAKGSESRNPTLQECGDDESIEKAQMIR